MTAIAMAPPLVVPPAATKEDPLEGAAVIYPSTRIAISGKAGSGKTSMARRLVANFGFERFSFAGRLREELASTLGISLVEFEFDKARWRFLMQEWGLARRCVAPGYWIRKLLVRLPVDRGKRVVVDDLRFYNEAMALKRDGFVLVRLDCPSSESLLYIEQTIAERAGEPFPDARGRAEAMLTNTHQSETDLDDYGEFDIHIDAQRSRSLDDIYADLVRALGLTA